MRWRMLRAASLSAMLVAIAPVGCRGDRAPAKDQATVSTSSPLQTVVPALPQSPDGDQELVALDLQIEQARRASDPEALISSLSRRAMLRGRHEDYREALDRALAWSASDHKDPRALAARIGIQIQIHDFVTAERGIEELAPLAQDSSIWTGLAATLFEARGRPELARSYRERAAEVHRTPANLTNLAANLAMRGQLDAAIAMIPPAAAALHDPSPVLVAWLLVQWGRLYVQKGEPAAARELFAEAHRRLPGYVEATTQLAAAMRATGGDPGEVVASALVAEPHHPELLALAGRTAEAHTAWTAYLEPPLVAAFADHAARFYLGSGRELARAHALAAGNDADRRTPESRALLVEADLASAKWDAACADAKTLTTSVRAHQFLAWRAFTACGHTAEATHLAQTLGIR